ncbi:beta-N-acetylhexosaminidase [Pokkaliibacter sp. CJK22405]|uniref:beta-N-acetylhexosaminidase n=1 Tax=Pokkaliibacter sp. CJK22405 TaxID=3384615 RepID=UPI003984FB1C
MSVTPLAGIFGCEGLELSQAEAAFFREANPLGLILFKRNCESPEQVKRLTDSFREAVGRQDAPILIDQEGGRIQRMQPPIWPQHPSSRDIGLIADKDLESGKRLAWLNARLIGDELAEVGVNVDAAPVLDLLVNGANEVIGSRAFSMVPEIVAELGRASCDGFLASGIIPVIKHMPGHGYAQADSHIELPFIDRSAEVLWGEDMLPFRELSSMPWAMTAHIMYPSLDPEFPCTQSAHIISHWIREKIGFQGVLITDCIHMNALKGTHAERAKASLDAGVDLILNSHGSVNEMEAVAQEVCALEGKALQRVTHSLTLLGKVRLSAAEREVMFAERQELLG